MKNLNNKLVQRIIISLQILYILLYFATSSINNIYFTFWLSAIISILSLILNIINKGNFKLLFILISITQILFTVFIYLLPEAGIPAPIKLF